MGFVNLGFDPWDLRRPPAEQLARAEHENAASDRVRIPLGDPEAENAGAAHLERVSQPTEPRALNER